MTDEIGTIIFVRICDHCQDKAKEAFPYGVHDANGKYWEILCNDCYDALGCSYPQDDEMVCAICGQPLEWENCWNGCDDGFIDRHDEDPLWYDEDDVEECDICDGAGGWWICPYAYKHEKQAEEPTQ